MKQTKTSSIYVWPPHKTATRDLSEDFFLTVWEIKDLVGLYVDNLVVSSFTPIDISTFNWDAAEKRANWEETHRHFVEFDDINDLLSDLHS